MYCILLWFNVTLLLQGDVLRQVEGHLAERFITLSDCLQ